MKLFSLLPKLLIHLACNSPYLDSMRPVTINIIQIFTPIASNA